MMLPPTEVDATARSHPTTGVAVVGAGAAGLYAALHAAEAGTPVTVVSRKRLVEAAR